jgi:hypothetical protein
MIYFKDQFMVCPAHNGTTDPDPKPYWCGTDQAPFTRVIVLEFLGS